MKSYSGCFGMLALGIAVTNGGAQSRGFTVRDDIAMVRFSSPSAQVNDDAAKFSPDGRSFAIVTSRGIVETNEIESTLSIFRADGIDTYLSAPGSANPPQPRTRIKIAAVLTDEQFDAYGAVISDLRWSSDSRYLYFLGDGRKNDRRLFRISIHGGPAIVLTPEAYNVARYDVAGNAIVCSLWRSDRPGTAGLKQQGDTHSDVRDVTGEPLKTILFPHSQPAPTDRELWVVRNRQGRPVAARIPSPSLRDISWLPEAFAMSPTGHQLIQLSPVDRVPPDWSGYDPAPGYEWSRIQSGNAKLTAANSVWRLKQYALVNLDDGASTPLIDAPHDYALMYPYGSQAIWSPDQRRVLLTNTFLPLAPLDDAERVRRHKPCAIAEVQLPSRQAHCIISVSDVTADSSGGILEDSLSFGRDDDEVVFRLKGSPSDGEVRRYTFDGLRWLRAKTTDDEAERDRSIVRTHLRVTIKQSLNERPKLWATDTVTGLSKMVWDSNPQLDHLLFGEASLYRWRDNSGYEWQGGLVKPVGYVPGKRYPLVIQIYNFDESKFLTDGSYPTAMAARHLASAGIVALQVQRRLPHTFNLAEGQAQLAGLESAIEHLTKDGLIDPSKVGLVGFSSTCWYVEYALIKAPRIFKAATIADGVDFSYMQYHLFGVSSSAVKKEYDAMNGAKPIGSAGLKQWADNALGFNLDRIVAPLRIEAIAPMSVLSGWEIYSSLKMQGKPVDLIYIPSGQHILQKPLERLASQQGNVDWFRFWLQGYEDRDPAQSGEYEQWRDMRQNNAAEK
jgi:dipeptidyl aminopeptidase/acylaminoacyl peptidase